MNKSTGFGFDFNTGFLVEHQKLQNPTIIICCSSDQFKSFLNGKLDFNGLFYSSGIDLLGMNVFRDLIIMEKIFGGLKGKIGGE